MGAEFMTEAEKQLWDEARAKFSLDRLKPAIRDNLEFDVNGRYWRIRRYTGRLTYEEVIIIRTEFAYRLVFIKERMKAWTLDTLNEDG